MLKKNEDDEQKDLTLTGVDVDRQPDNVFFTWCVNASDLLRMSALTNDQGSCHCSNSHALPPEIGFDRI